MFLVGSLIIDFPDSVASLNFLLRDGINDQGMVGDAYSFLVCNLFATMCQWKIPSTLFVYLW
jgi:hypothetical protein